MIYRKRENQGRNIEISVCKNRGIWYRTRVQRKMGTEKGRLEVKETEKRQESVNEYIL